MFVIVHCGKEIEHNAAFDKVLFPIRSPSPSPSEGSPTRLLSHVSHACTALSKHGDSCTVISCRWDTGGDGHRRIMATHGVGVELPF